MFDACKFVKSECIRRSIAQVMIAASAPVPDDTTKFVLLKTVKLAIGRVRHGTDWTGFECFAEFPPPLPDIVPPSLYQGLKMGSVEEDASPASWYATPEPRSIDYAKKLLGADAQVSPRNMLGSDVSTPAFHWRPFTVGEWRRAQELSELHRDAVHEASSRHSAICCEIRRFFAEGELQCVLRPIAGGEFSAVFPSWIWNTERCHSRFVTSQMNRQELFDGSSRAAPTDWIFCARDGFERLRDRLMSPTSVQAQSSNGLPYLSEFMRCCLEVSHSLGMSETDQPTKEAVMNEAKRLWQGPAPLSDTMAEKLACVVRSLDSQGGKNSRLYKGGSL